jgi:hypothetical protein
MSASVQTSTTEHGNWGLFRSGAHGLQILCEDRDRVLCPGWRADCESGRGSVLVVMPAAERPLPASLHRLSREYELRDELDSVWSARPAVVGRIRNLSKKATPRDERVDINTAIREVIELTRNEARKNGVVVQTELVEGVPLVHGDRVELQQVILNLILNAVEAISELSEGSRELLITTGNAESGDVLVAVRDSGPGLAPAAIEDLFKAFHTTKPNGLGLGLSICRSIVEAHGGRLWASANAPGGAVFQFTLPAHPESLSSPATHAGYGGRHNPEHCTNQR